MKKTLIGIIAIIITVTLYGCNSNETQKNNQEPSITEVHVSLEDYKSQIADCVNDITEQSLLLSNLATYQNNYWKALSNISGNADKDSIIKSGWKWFEKNAECTSDVVFSEYDTICDKYRSIISTNISGDEADEVTAYFKEIFNAYCDFYFLINNPGGNRSDYVDKYNTDVDTIKSNNNKLAIFVEDITEFN